MILTFRLNENEVRMIDEILSSEKCESENRSEWLRLLIHREWNKRKKLGVPDTSYQTANRIGGRPSWYQRQQKLRLAGKTRNTPLCRHKRVTRPALSNFSPSPTRAANGVLVRTKSPRVTRRAGLKKPAGKLK
jgi:hypothetical protein